MDARNPARVGGVRELLRIALPLVMSSGSLTLMIVVDRMFLTWYSSEALAASMPAGLLDWTLLSLAVGTGAYVNTFIAQYEGARQPERVAAVLWQGAYFAVLAGALMMLAIPISPWIFSIVDHHPTIQPLEVEYFNVLCCGAIPAILSATLACFYSGRGKTLVVFWVNLAGSLVNIVLDYWFIFGGLGLPSMGIRGAAMATNLGSVAMVLIYLGLLWGTRDARSYALARYFRFDRELFLRLLRFGIPNGIHSFVDVFCFSLFVFLVGGLGADELAATSMAINLNSMAFVPMLGFGTAIMTIVGQRVGEGRPALAVRTVWIAFILSTAYFAAFSVVYWFFPDEILSPYSSRSNPEAFERMRPIVILLLRFVAIYSLFDAMNIVFRCAICGAGDTRFSMILTAIMGLGIMVVPTFAWIRYFEGGVAGAWGAATVYVAALGFGFLLRFQGKKWQRMKVIEDPIEDLSEKEQTIPFPDLEPAARA